MPLGLSPKLYSYRGIFDDSVLDTEQFCIPSHRTAQCTHCALQVCHLLLCRRSVRTVTLGHYYSITAIESSLSNLRNSIQLTQLMQLTELITRLMQVTWDQLVSHMSECTHVLRRPCYEEHSNQCEMSQRIWDHIFCGCINQLRKSTISWGQLKTFQVVCMYTFWIMV